MKKKLFGWALSLVVLFWACSVVNAATYIPVDEKTSLTTNCTPSESNDYYYYLTDDGSSTNPYDNFGVNWADALIWGWSNGSSIDIWRWKAGDEVLRPWKCNTWERMSNIVKNWDDVLVFLNRDNCVFDRPNYTKISNPDAIDAQIHFSIWYRKVRSNWPLQMSNSPLYYIYYGQNQFHCYSNWNITTDTNICATSVNYWDQVLSHLWECQNYRIFWCGDGLVNGSKNWQVITSYDNWTFKEECDPAAPEWKNRTDWKKCSASCTIEQAPICNSTYNGKRVYTNTSSQYLNGSEWLCVSWSAFSFTPSRTVWNPRIFTWGCTSSVGSTSADACNYKQYRCGDGIVSAEWTNWNYSNGAHYESCDPAAPEWKNRTDWKKCNSSCNVEYVPASCGPVDREDAKYNSNHPKQRITENTAWLCGTWQLKAWSFKYDEDTWKYTWDCVNGSSTAHCDAQDLWCGDGEVTNGEQCDPNDSDRTWWKDGSWKTCNSSCKLEDIPRTGPLCSSVYNGVTEYTSTSNPWISTSDTLCSKWNLVPWSFSYNGTAPRKFTWSCTNDWITTGCVAYQQWCGDGQKNGNEACDPADGSHSWWWDDWCSNTCEPKYGVKCGSKYNGKTTYLDISKDWINENTPGLCDSWNVVNFYKHPSSHVYTWQCENHDKVSEECRADQEWCGDEKRNGNEDCDPKDPNETNRWSDWCSQLCEKVIIPSSGCDEVFHYTLRQGEDYIFWDIFHANDTDRRLYGNPIVNFIEPKDYNRWANPTFRWTNRDSNKKVSEGDSIKVVESTPAYHIYDHPDVRSDDNLYIEYDLQYANRENAPESRRKTHKECVYYEISRCGDGEIDEEYGEECDPGDSSEKNWWNGWCDENTCTPVNVAGPICNSTYNGQTVENLTENDDLCEEWTVSDFKFDETTNTWTWKCDNVAWEWVECSAKKPSKWTAEIEKVLQDKKEVDHTWQALDWKVTVTAKWWDITDFEIWDKMPIELDYVDFEFDKTHSQAGMDVKYSNRKPNPEKSWNVNIHYWDVKWALKEWNSITIIVKTKVNKMPEAWKDILNIACVIKDKETLDCDDDTPPSPKWTAEIEKTLDNKIPVDHTGQDLTWTVKVTAKWWDISDFEIWDKMPIELDYVDFEVDKIRTQNWITVTYDKNRSPERSWNVNIHYWDVKWTLKEWNSILMKVKTTVNRMPGTWEDILNIACVVKDNKEIDCGEDTPPSPKEWTLDVIKTLISEDKYVSEIWQELKWKISVKAKDGDVELDKIIDKFPAKYLEYTGYETVGNWQNEWISINNVNADNQRGIVTWDVSWTLKEWHTIELIVYTKVHTMPDVEVVNVWCVKPVDPWKEECGTGYTSSLRIKKYVWDKNKRAKSTTGNSWDTITYRIEFGNYGDTGVYVTLKDFLPKDIEVKESSLTLNYASHDTEFWWENIDPVRWRWEKVDNVYINIYSWVYLWPNVSWVMMITGTALHVESSTHNRTNFVCIYENGKKIACDDAVYNVEEDKELKCESISLSPSSTHVSYDETPKWTTTVTCETTWGKADMQMICGDEVVSSWTNVSKLTWECSFEWVGEHDVKCLVKNNKTNRYEESNKCNAKYKITKWTPPGGHQWTTPECVGIDVDYLNNGKVEVTCHADEAAYIRINWCYNSKDNLRSEDKVKNYTVTCESINNLKCSVRKNNSDEWESDDQCKYTKEESINQFETCFNVNAWNFSIEEWEILPFYWNLNRLPNIVGKNHTYIEIAGGNYENAKSIVENPELYNEEACNPWTIAADSMVCTFKIYDGWNYFKWMKDNKEKNDPLYEISGPCLSSYTESDFKDGDQSLLVDWYDTMIERYCNNSRTSKECLSFKLPDLSDGALGEREDWSDLLHSSIYYIKNFWNYSKTETFLAGIAQERGWSMSNKNGEHAYWEFKIVLDEVKYLQCNNEGQWEQKLGDITKCQSNFMLTNSYTVQKTPAWNITASTDELNKYLDIEWKDQKFSRYLNAIAATTYTPNNNVNNALDSFKKKYEKIAVEVKGNNNIPKDVTVKKVPGKNIYFADGDITIIWEKDIKNPFTRVVDWKVTIKWDVKYNMMVLAKDIEFEWDCTSTQNVKWIYYASNNLSRDWVGKNDSASNSKWCTEWWLHIQWVLIWKNFETLMKKSRSNINDWFYVKANGTQEQRRKMIMNGASVLIEYSPSIFTKSTMPPGAEDFVSALSIYKQ